MSKIPAKAIVMISSLAILVWIAVMNMELKGEYPGLPAVVDFNFDVKPILVQKCYLCHGPDPSSRKGGLRLDTEAGATQLLKSGNAAINRDHPDISALISRIEHKDPDMVMPPPDSKMLLTEKEIAILSKWIKQGAEWKPHWAFIKLDSTVYDQVKNIAGNPVDFFVRQKLEENGLQPVPEANKNSLIRRVAYLLTGLPPSAAAIEQFIADKSSTAYEQMIDRYLASPAFGERWARHWMDLARYAETRGHEFDFAIDGTWRYRDYLIRCFNNDIGYDQMVKEQLAGDLLEHPRRNAVTGANESQLGTVFLSMMEGVQGPVDVRQDEADKIDNMIDVTSKTFQSLTVSCARCHDHKFDPIPTADYYSLYGIMESTRFSPVPANRGADDEKRMLALDASTKNIRKAIAAAWLQRYAGKPEPFQTVRYSPAPEADPGYTMIGDFRKTDFGVWKTNGLAFGTAPTMGNPVFDSLHTRLLYLSEGAASSRVNGSGIFGALRSPNFTITDDSITIRAMGKDATVRIIIDNFQFISHPIYGDITRSINSGEWENITIGLSTWKGHNAYIEIMPGFFDTHVYKLPADAYVEVQYALSFTGKMPVPANDASTGNNSNLVQAIEHWQTQQCTKEEIQLLNANIKKGILPKERLGITGIDQQPGVTATAQIHDTAFYNGVYDGYAINSPVFIRGDHKQLSENRVPRHFFTALNTGNTTFQSNGSGRLDLAESMLANSNPLTARVMANRIWHWMFGKGIVETVDNFGLQGKLPTNLPLLDYLAIRFQKDNWSVKKMVRLMLLSKTFRRSTEVTEAVKKKDPANLYLARFPLLRLEAEAIRDGMLVASGRLDTTMYGPPVAVHLTPFMNGRGKPGASGPVDGAGRRSIYQEVRRNFQDPMMLTFDRPIPFSTFGNRNVTNVPAQSLFFMNDPFVVMQAEGMAKKLMQPNNKTVEDRIQSAYITVFARPAVEDEIKRATAFLEELAGVHKVNPKEIWNSTEIWKDYCHSLFNLKEFIFLI
jgi:hypothetical protein